MFPLILIQTLGFEFSLLSFSMFPCPLLKHQVTFSMIIGRVKKIDHLALRAILTPSLPSSPGLGLALLVTLPNPRAVTFPWLAFQALGSMFPTVDGRPTWCLARFSNPALYKMLTVSPAQFSHARSSAGPSIPPACMHTPNQSYWFHLPHFSRVFSQLSSIPADILIISCLGH